MKKTILAAMIALASTVAHAWVPSDVTRQASETPAFAYAHWDSQLFLLSHKACPIASEKDNLGVAYYAYRGRAYPYLMCWKENGDHIVETRIDFDSAGAAYAVGMPPLSISEGAFMKGDPRPTSAFE